MEQLEKDFKNYDKAIDVEQVEQLGYSLELSEEAVTSALSQALINVAVELRHIKYYDAHHNKDEMIVKLREAQGIFEKKVSLPILSEVEVNEMISRIGLKIGLNDEQVEEVVEFVVSVHLLLLFKIYISYSSKKESGDTGTFNSICLFCFVCVSLSVSECS
jgi:hypothetical protein